MLFIILTILVIILVLLKIFLVCTNTRCTSNVCLIGKTALVTGGNSGIGYHIVLALASRGCRVIIADKEQGPDLKENIFRETNSKNIIYHYVDLASFKSVREFAQNLIKSEEKLDILVHNAGMARTKPFLTEDDLDMTMQVNYFSPFLLTHLFIDLLKKSSGRIIFTSSLTAYFFNLSLGDLKPSGINKDTSPFIYAHSKFGLLVINNIFAQKLKKYKITSNSYHPGAVKTRIFKETIKQSKEIVNLMSLLVKLMEILTIIVGKTPEEGGQSAIYLACANEAKDVTGQFFYELKPTYKPRKVYDEKFCQSIWEATEEIVKLGPHEKL